MAQQGTDVAASAALVAISMGKELVKIRTPLRDASGSERERGRRPGRSGRERTSRRKWREPGRARGRGVYDIPAMSPRVRRLGRAPGKLRRRWTPTPTGLREGPHGLRSCSFSEGGVRLCFSTTAPCPVHADRGLPSQRVPPPERLLQGEVSFRALSLAALCPGAWLFAQVMSPVGWRGQGKPISFRHGESRWSDPGLSSCPCLGDRERVPDNHGAP